MAAPQRPRDDDVPAPRRVLAVEPLDLMGVMVPLCTTTPIDQGGLGATRVTCKRGAGGIHA
ncbi:MAG: hypothetical protein ABR613_07115 [Actinomycetota bacterium]